jgi:hypothetical protein
VCSSDLNKIALFIGDEPDYNIYIL